MPCVWCQGLPFSVNTETVLCALTQYMEVVLMEALTDLHAYSSSLFRSRILLFRMVQVAFFKGSSWNATFFPINKWK